MKEEDESVRISVRKKKLPNVNILPKTWPDVRRTGVGNRRNDEVRVIPSGEPSSFKCFFVCQ